MKVFDVLDLTAPGVVLGNHGIWLPDRQIKVPFQWGGRLAKYSRPGERTWSRDQIVDEVAILRALAVAKMAPPVGDLVFFRNVVSSYQGAWHCDPCGAYGYEFADADKLPPGNFDLAFMRSLQISGSEGAWNDVSKPGNVVNGYLVDARRSGQDILHWTGEREPLLDGREDPGDLCARVHRDCQFPTGEREQAYQDFWLRGVLQVGQRRVVERARLLGFAPQPGESVLDVGCQSASFLQYGFELAQKTGSFAGIDINPAYVECARALARSCDQNICIRQMNAVDEYMIFINWVQSYFPRGVDHLLLLSMEKHLGHTLLFRVIDAVQAKHTYIETNAVAKDDGVGELPAGAMKLWAEVQERGGVHVGDSRDRNLRRLYRIDR